MSNIITENPKIRKKGFKNENYYQFKDAKDFIGVSEKIEKIKTVNLSDSQRLILNKIKNSYKKLFNNTSLDKEDFILTKQEVLEFENIDQDKLLRYLIYRYKYNKYPELKYLDEYPPCIQIEPTSICNLRCVMCYQSDKSFSVKSSGHMGYMNIDLFRKIVDEIEGKIEAVTFASRGEPTLSPILDEMLKYSYGKFLALKINTNATLLNEKKIHSLLSSDLQTIVFSIDEYNKENYEKIRVNAKFEKVISNLELFRTIKEKDYKDSKVQVRVSGVKINKDQDIEAISKFYKTFCDQVTLVNYNPWQSAYDNEINEIKDPCSELFRRIFIWWDGKVNPCDYDYKSYLSKWNAKEKSVKDIWNSEYYNKIRESHINQQRSDVEPCNRCIAV